MYLSFYTMKLNLTFPQTSFQTCFRVWKYTAWLSFSNFSKKFFFFNIISPEELYVLDQSSSLITKASKLGSKQAQAPILTGQAFGGEGRAESHSPVDRRGWQ